MRSIVIIYKQNGVYLSDLAGRFGSGHRGLAAGQTADAAALTAARLMVEYARSNPRGGELIAPADVLALVPACLHSVPAHGTVNPLNPPPENGGTQ